MRTEPPLRTFLRTFVSTNGRRRPSYAPFFYFGVLFIAREGKCGAKRREKFDCWACQHQFLVNNNHSKARCTQELLLLRLKSLLLLCVLAGWFLQDRKEREANEQQQREAPRKIPRYFAWRIAQSKPDRERKADRVVEAKHEVRRRKNKERSSTTSSKHDSEAKHIQHDAEAKHDVIKAKHDVIKAKHDVICLLQFAKSFFPCLLGGAVGGGGRRRRPGYEHGGPLMRPRRGRDAP